MALTIDKLKQDVIGKLGFPELVNFGTLENNYTDADEVGTIINRVFDDCMESCLRNYPWAFCRADGVITGVKDSSPEARFPYSATISLANFFCIQAVFDDPRHYSPMHEWRIYGTNQIKFRRQKVYVEYTQSFNITNCPRYFAEYLIATVALEASPMLRLESKIPQLSAMQAQAFLDARKQDSMGEPAPANFDNIIDESRWMM